MVRKAQQKKKVRRAVAESDDESYAHVYKNKDVMVPENIDLQHHQAAFKGQDSESEAAPVNVDFSY